MRFCKKKTITRVICKLKNPIEVTTDGENFCTKPKHLSNAARRAGKFEVVEYCRN
jgi:hypothetical protein